MSKQLTEKDLETLAEMTLFCGLSAAELNKLMEFAPVRRYKARTVIMEKGDAPFASMRRAKRTRRSR